MSPYGLGSGATKGDHTMYSEFNSPLLGHALLGAVLAIFALGMAFWLLLAFRIACAVVRKRATLERALLANPKPQSELASRP
jgi:hypothetical protein